ncbi:MAG: formate/nitrite transporter family protein [Dethiobacteria bacterium]
MKTTTAPAAAACHPPPKIAENVVRTAEKKAATKNTSLLLLAFLAGVYIALGAVLFSVVTNDLAAHIGDGMSRLVGGMTFSLGLVIVVLGGAELFTCNNLIMTMGFLQKRINYRQVLYNWTWVYLFNVIGAILIAVFFLFSGIWKANDGAIALRAVDIAYTKVSLPWSEALFRGILCNWMVCLAVWLSLAGKDAISKIVGIVLPITASTAIGFEHSIANTYFVSMGIFLKAQTGLQEILTPLAIEGLTWRSFFTNNLIPVTIGNIIGGAIFVAVIYWQIYLRSTLQNTAGKPAAGSARSEQKLPS